MIESTAVRETMLEFYERIEANDVHAFDRLVADDPARLVIGPGALVSMTAEMARTARSARAAGAAVRSAVGP